MTDEIMMDGKPLKAGDEVYCLLNGKGKVESIDSKAKFPIEVAFSHGYCTYTKTFKGWTNHENRTLYWQKPEIIPPPRPKKKVKVRDWFVEWPNGDTNKMCGETEQYARNGVNIAQKIDGTEREIEVIE